MTFTSPFFFLTFFPITVVGYVIFSKFGRRSMVTYLALLSILFYAVSLYVFSKRSVVYTGVLLASIAVNYLFSKLIERTASRPRWQSFWLGSGIVANLSALCYYKYLFPLLGFLAGLGWVHGDVSQVFLPLGISFFTFTQIAYLIDLKQGQAKTETPESYSLFVTFFPHLIAGPILHHKEMMPQFRRERRFGLDANDVAVGLTWFVMGFFKKTMIADRVAPAASRLFASPDAAGAWTTWHGVLLYMMQLYFDFSGYSDMAIGLARVFSIRFPMNFNSPYKATSVLDYWQRWHMTLTRYIMAYLYSPMQMWVSRKRLDAGKKVSRKAQGTWSGFSQMVAGPTIVTLLLAGIWHGAGLQFLLYGLMHGLYLTLNHAWRIFVPEKSLARRAMTSPVALGITFLCVMVGDVMFRANSVASALSVYRGLLGVHGAGSRTAMSEIVLLAALFAVVWLMPNTQEILGEAERDDAPNWSVLPKLRWRVSFGWWAATAVALVASAAYSAAGSTFLYFQF